MSTSNETRFTPQLCYHNSHRWRLMHTALMPYVNHKMNNMTRMFKDMWESGNYKINAQRNTVMDRPEQFNPPDARIVQISTHASLPHKTLVLDKFQWICSHKNTNSHWKCMHATTPKPHWKSLSAKQKLARAACSEKTPTKRDGKQDASQILIQTQSENLLMLHVLRRHQQNHCERYAGP